MQLNKIDPVVIILIGIPFLLIYFFPSFVGRRKKRLPGIILVNLLFGWTAIGWLAVLYWAYKTSYREVNLIYRCEKCGFKKGIPKKTRLFECPMCKTAQKLKRRAVQEHVNRFDD